MNTFLFNYALDNAYYKGGTGGAATCYVKLTDTTDTLIDDVTVNFTAASGGVTDLVSSVYLTVPSGTTIKYLYLYANNTTTEYSKTTLDEETFTSNGTFTLSDYVVTYGEA